MKKGLVSLIFIIVASTIYSQTLKNYCDTARNYIIDGKTTPVLPVLPKVYGSFMTENVRFTAHKKLRYTEFPTPFPLKIRVAWIRCARKWEWSRFGRNCKRTMGENGI